MIKNRFLLYLLCGVMVSPAAALGECKPTQDCRALGYKEAPCPEQGVKCPFGETWYCPLRCKDGEVWENGKCEAKGGELGQCTGYAKNCKIGDILNSDGTCSNDKVSGKAPIGVVVAIKDNCGWAMTADPKSPEHGWINGVVEWAVRSLEKIDILSLPNYTTRQTAIKDFDACGNTKKITQAGDVSNYPAAWVALNYAPDEAPETKGKWCLPAAGILSSLYTKLDVINNSISKLGGKQLKDNNENVWSSSETDDTYVWSFCTGAPGCVSGYGIVMRFKNNSNNAFVRPVIEF